MTLWGLQGPRDSTTSTLPAPGPRLSFFSALFLSSFAMSERAYVKQAEDGGAERSVPGVSAPCLPELLGISLGEKPHGRAVFASASLAQLPQVSEPRPRDVHPLAPGWVGGLAATEGPLVSARRCHGSFGSLRRERLSPTFSLNSSGLLDLA